MWAALFWHPALAPYWQETLGEEGDGFLKSCTPRTWILDPGPVPPQALSGLTLRGSQAKSWDALKDLGRKQRELVIKPSGFSDKAWGSRGVVVGHDISTSEWNAAWATALEGFTDTPHILQEFRSGRRFEGEFYDPETGSVHEIACRVRLSPYFLVVGDEVKLTAVMATMCPLDKKKIHGMPAAIIVPCCAQEDPQEAQR